MLTQLKKDIENIIDRGLDNGLNKRDVEITVLDLLNEKFKKKKLKKKICRPVMFISDSSDEE